MKAIPLIIGLGLILISLFSGIFAVIAFLDPVGTKMADDADPFGPPSSRRSSAITFGITLVAGATGVYLVRHAPLAR